MVKKKRREEECVSDSLLAIDSRFIELEHATVMYPFSWLLQAWEKKKQNCYNEIVLLIAG